MHYLFRLLIFSLIVSFSIAGMAQSTGVKSARVLKVVATINCNEPDSGILAELPDSTLAGLMFFCQQASEIVTKGADTMVILKDEDGSLIVRPKSNKTSRSGEGIKPE